MDKAAYITMAIGYDCKMFIKLTIGCVVQRSGDLSGRSGLHSELLCGLVKTLQCQARSGSGEQVHHPVRAQIFRIRQV